MDRDKPKLEVRNVNAPDHVSRVDAEKYEAMKSAYLKILPDAAPGITQKEAGEQVIRFLPEHLFPGGSKAMWWLKTVQLDLEYKGVVIREVTKPLRWYKKKAL